MNAKIYFKPSMSEVVIDGQVNVMLATSYPEEDPVEDKWHGKKNSMSSLNMSNTNNLFDNNSISKPFVSDSPF